MIDYVPFGVTKFKKNQQVKKIGIVSKKYRYC